MINRAARSRESVLVSGPPGSGKRALAELMHRLAPAAELGGTAADPGGLKGELAYLGPIEVQTVEAQATLLDHHASHRLVIGTQLDLAGAEVRTRLHPRVLERCRVHVQLPSLRERIEDLEALTLQIVCASPSSRLVGGISDAALACLRGYPWPGNLAELEEVIGRALAAGEGGQIELEDLPAALHRQPREDPGVEPDLSLVHAERAAIERAMRYARGNKRKAARLLQIGKTTLYRKLRGYHDLDDELGFEDP